MNLKNILDAESISISLQGNTKGEIIGELLDLLVQAGRVSNRAGALEALLAREKRMSTGMQNGLAIPHAKTDTVDRLVAAFGVKREGADFDSLDGKPSCLFLMTLSPLNRTGPHIQFLAEVGRIVSSAPVRGRLMSAATPREVLDVLTSG